MEMIIGGAWQGKEAYARKKWPAVEFREGGTLTREELLKAEGVLRFHEYIHHALLRGESLENLAQELIDFNPRMILVTQELGCGLVPMEAFDRRSREETGRICTQLAAFSTSVTRIICGLPVCLKG